MENKIEIIMTLNKFKNMLGGRINYSSVNKYCITIEYDFLLFNTFIRYRALGYSNWECGNQFRKLLPISDFNGMEYRFSAYNNHFINRFYKIRKAIKQTQKVYKITTYK